MKAANLIKTITFLSLLLALSACSTVGAKSGDNNLNGQSGMTTTGIGSQSAIQGINVSQSMLLRAPHNQSYYFNFDKNLVKSQYASSIDAQANYLIRHSNRRVLLAGNTDARGSHEYNIALGQRRALAVAAILKMDGFNKNQISVISYGDMKPVALGHSEAAYAQNRRVDLTYEGK